MTDEMTIQQQSPSALPYVGVGGALGAAGGYGLSRVDAVKKRITEPAKYSSYEDIIKEADDKFTKTLNEAEGEEKEMLEKVKTAREEGVKAGEKWENDKKAYLEANKSGETPALPSDNDAQKAYDTKRKELIDKEVERLKQAQPKGTVKNEKGIKALEEKISTAEKKFAEQTKSVNEVIESIANQKFNRLEKLNEKPRTKGFMKQFNILLEKQDKRLAEWVDSLQGLTEAQKKNLLEQARTVIDNRLIIAELEHAKVPEFTFAKTKQNAEKLLNDYVSTLDKNQTGFKKDTIAKYIANPSSEDNRKVMDRILKAEEKKLEKVKDFQKKYAEFVKEASPEEVKKVITIKGGGNVSKHIMPTMVVEITEQSSEAAKKLKTAFDTLSKEEKATLQRLVGDNPTAESIAENIKNLERNIKNIRTATTSLNNLQAEMDKVAGEGSYIKDGKLYNKAGQEVKAKIDIPTNLDTKVTLPEPKELKGLRKSLEEAKGSPVKAMTESELTAQATKNIDAKAGELLKAEQDAINKAREALPKNPEKSVEQLTKEFIEKHGTKENAIKEAQNTVKEDVKKLFEGKTSKGKLGAVIACTAALGALIGLAIKPSSNEA